MTSGEQPHDIPALVAAKLLKPMGNPAGNSTKYFATTDLLVQTRDRYWFARMTSAIYQHWRGKNAGKRTQSGRPAELELSRPLVG